MPIYWVSAYYINQNKVDEYQKWLKSDRAKKLAAEFEKETGFKYLNTYFPILGFGKYDCEDWYVAPDWSSFDKLRTSKASVKMMEETWDFMDWNKPTVSSRVMRTAEDVMVYLPPKKKKK
jgi:hypothetical protein